MLNGPIINADGTCGRPADVGEGHELGHAWYAIYGRVDIRTIQLIDPDLGDKLDFQINEISVRRDVENKLRQESFIVPGALPTNE